MEDSADLTLKLATIEKRVARLRIFTWTAFALAGAALAWGMFERRSPITEGQLWVSRDSEGRMRAMFGVSNDGVALTMYDSTGQMRLDVGIAPGGVPGIMMLSSRGEPVASLNLIEGSIPTLRLTNVAEKARIQLEPRAGQPPLTLREPGVPDTVLARRGAR